MPPGDDPEPTEGSKEDLRAAYLLGEYTPAIDFDIHRAYNSGLDEFTTTVNGALQRYPPLAYVVKGFRKNFRGPTGPSWQSYEGTPFQSSDSNWNASHGAGGANSTWTAPLELGGQVYSAANGNLTSDGWPWFMEGYEAPKKTFTFTAQHAPTTITYAYVVGHAISYSEDGYIYTQSEEDDGNIDTGDTNDYSDSNPDDDGNIEDGGDSTSANSSNEGQVEEFNRDDFDNDPPWEW